MKNQYFGDVNDFRKYGLLRALQHDTEHKLLVAWMLTPDDGGKDGRFRGYLQRPKEFERLDPELYGGMRMMLRPPAVARVSLLEDSNLLPRSVFYTKAVPDARPDRDEWREALVETACKVDMVFFDPDNGIEIASKPVGRKGSSKYVTWKEIEAVWFVGCSLIIYQHFRREPREAFAESMVAAIRERTGAIFTEAFRTPHVMFLLIAQTDHAESLWNAINCRISQWKGQIDSMGLADKLEKPTGNHA